MSTTVLGDWFTTALFWKPQVALLVNQRNLLPVFMPLAPAATLVTRVPEAIAALLRNTPSNVVELRPQSKPPVVRRAGNRAHAFQLKVTLLGTKPPVWRRIVVDASTSLDRLHETI